MISYGTALQSFSVFLYRELIFATSDFENHTVILTKINRTSLREWVGFSTCRILLSYGEEYYDCGFLECDTVYYGWVKIFRRNLLPVFKGGRRNKQHRPSGEILVHI